jgi:hypothetical protein
MVSEERLDEISQLMSAVTDHNKATAAIESCDTRFRWIVMCGFLLLAFGFIFNRYDLAHEPNREEMIKVHGEIIALNVRLEAAENRITAISLIRRKVDECKTLSELIMKEVILLKNQTNGQISADKVTQ